MSGFDLGAYLELVGLPQVPPTAEGLARLQSAHIARIPFETLDPFLGILPGVGSAEVANKILRGGRGGYCFEQNRLLQDALEALGLAVDRRLARVRRPDGQSGTRTHLLLICRIDGTDYLTDAGFGGPSPRQPIRLSEDLQQSVSNGTYVLRRDPVTNERVLHLCKPDGEWPLYGFDEAFVSDLDISAGNFLCCHWSGAPFPRHLMAKGYDGSTPIGLLDRNLNEGGRKRRMVDAEDLHHILSGRLNLNIDRQTVEAAWTRLETIERERGPSAIGEGPPVPGFH